MAVLTGAAAGSAASVSGRDQADDPSSHAALAQTDSAAPAAVMSDDAADHEPIDGRDASKAPPDGIVTKLVSAAEAALSKLTTNGSSQAHEEQTMPQPA